MVRKHHSKCQNYLVLVKGWIAFPWLPNYMDKRGKDSWVSTASPLYQTFLICSIVPNKPHQAECNQIHGLHILLPTLAPNHSWISNNTATGRTHNVPHHTRTTSQRSLATEQWLFLGPKTARMCIWSLWIKKQRTIHNMNWRAWQWGGYSHIVNFRSSHGSSLFFTLLSIG